MRRARFTRSDFPFLNDVVISRRCEPAISALARLHSRQFSAFDSLPSVVASMASQSEQQRIMIIKPRLETSSPGIVYSVPTPSRKDVFAKQSESSFRLPTRSEVSPSHSLRRSSVCRSANALRDSVRSLLYFFSAYEPHKIVANNDNAISSARPNGAHRVASPCCVLPFCFAIMLLYVCFLLPVASLSRSLALPVYYCYSTFFAMRSLGQSPRWRCGLRFYICISAMNANRRLSPHDTLLCFLCVTV